MEDFGNFAHRRHKTMLADSKTNAAPGIELRLRRHQARRQLATALVNFKQQFEGSQ